MAEEQRQDESVYVSEMEAWSEGTRSREVEGEKIAQQGEDEHDGSRIQAVYMQCGRHYGVRVRFDIMPVRCRGTAVSEGLTIVRIRVSIPGRLQEGWTRWQT